MKRMALFLTVVLALSSTVFGANVNTTQDKDTMALGKLYFVNLEEGKQPVMTGLTLAGNRCGTGDFNNKPYATEGIRSVFELDEWVEFYPETKAVTGIRVMVFQHKADQGFYMKNALNADTPGYIQECDLRKDPDAEETSQWGSFYLHPDEVAPGYYDFVFICNNKVFATMLTKFYKPEELQDKSNSELEELMKSGMN